jgi:hypothetical protein
MYENILIFFMIILSLVIISVIGYVIYYIITEVATTKPPTTTVVPTTTVAPTTKAPTTTPTTTPAAPITAPTTAAPIAQKTVRQKLQEICPLDPEAGDKINKGNSATYNDYMFSGCEAAKTCDSTEPDPISKAILNKTEPCGAWILNSTRYTYDLTNKWRPM